MNAASIAHALGGRRSGSGWSARCPAHDDCDPSLSISVSHKGKTLVHCHAGCSQEAVVGALKDRGLWNTGEDDPYPRIVRAQFDRDRKVVALDIWNSSIPAQNTLVEAYLRSRGIALPIPPALRFHHALRHHPTGTTWPAMLALVTGADGAPVAIHRTYLARDGKRKAPATPQKMMLGSCRAGAVRLGEIQRGKSLAISEGIETGLSVAQACRFPVWAALSADGMKSVSLPPEANMVILCADNDVNGVGRTVANAAYRRFLREGRSARITMPPDVGTDFNDLLLKAEERKSCHVRHRHPDRY